MAHPSGKGKRAGMPSEESGDPYKKRKNCDNDDDEEEKQEDDEEEDEENEDDESDDLVTDGHTSGVTTRITKGRKKKVEEQELIDDVITAAGLRTYENSRGHSRIFHKEYQRDKPLRKDLQGQDKEILNGVIDGFARYAIQAGTKLHYASVHIQKGSEFTDEHVRRLFKRSLNSEDVWLTRSGTPIRDERFKRDEEFGSGEVLWIRGHTTRRTSSIGAAVTAKQSKSHRKK